MKQSTKNTYRLRNWGEYNKSLVNRGDLTLWIELSSLSAWTLKESSGRRGASRYYSDVSIQCMLMVQAATGFALRQTVGFVRSHFKASAIELDVPDYTTICRRRPTLAVSLGVRANRKPIHLVVDSTGLKVYGEGEWKVRKHGWCKHRTWMKLHIGVDERTLEVVSEELTTNRASDSDPFEGLLAQIPGPIRQVSGDGGYDTRKVYEATSKRGALAIIPPQKNARIWKHGNSAGERMARDENLRAIRKHGKPKWKRDAGYHRRSLVETTMLRFKTTFGGGLSSRRFDSQCAEARIKCAMLNRMIQNGRPISYAVGK